MTTILIIIVLVMAALFLVLQRPPADVHAQPLDVTGRTPLSDEEWLARFYSTSQMDKAAIVKVRDHVAGRSTLAPGLLDPTDPLDQLAAAGGLNRAMLVADLMTTFPEAEGAISRKMLAGEFTLLHHAIVLVASAPAAP